ncbi:MAG: DUF5719 family protein [Bifidobacteriaceae bacterium]|jgi:hypothetical protein|nr:DUF5719 family protein [Bifidobacteriaceae bacterium]
MAALRRVLSILSAIGLLAGAAGLVWADSAIPAPPSAMGVPQEVAVPPGDSIAVCPGALRGPTEGEGEVVYDPRFDPEATFVEAVGRGVVEGGDGGRATPLEEGAATALTGPLAVTTQTVGPEAVRLEAYSSQAEPALATGAVFQHLGDGDLRGLAATPCVEPAAEAWLVAGSTETGSSARLLLTNAGFTTVTASLALWDGAGPVEAVGLEGMVVPARSQRAVLLEGFAGDVSRLAARVTASGGELAVFLQHSRLEGLTQGGTELAVPGLAPAKEVVIPGLNVTASDFDTPRASAIRLVNPGAAAANVQVELWGPDGPTSLPGLGAAQVGAGLVSDLSLAGLPAGRYIAKVVADRPVAAAGLSLRAGEPSAPEEFAWTNSATALARGFLALPEEDLQAHLVAGAAEATSLTVTPIDAAGKRGQPGRLEASAASTVTATPGDLGADAATVAFEFAWDGEPGWLALAVSASDAAGEMISAVIPRGAWAEGSAIGAYPVTR